MESTNRRRNHESYDLDESISESSIRRKRRASISNIDTNSEDKDIVVSFCGRDSLSVRLFGVVFPCRSYPLDASNFMQMDATHWVLDMSIFVGESYDEVKDICIFLVDKLSIPPTKALALYVQSPGSHFQYCGAVCQSCPSAVLPLLWPNANADGQIRQLAAPDSAPLTAKIGIAVEDLVTLPSLDVKKQRQLELLALKVGENLLGFLQLPSLGDKLIKNPLDVFNKWLKKFEEKLYKDSEYTKSLLA